MLLFKPGYVVMDVIDKSIKTYKKETKLSESNLNTESPLTKSAKNGADCFLWQTFASGKYFLIVFQSARINTRIKRLNILLF